MIGRKREKDILERCLTSNRPEFVVVYGRRRVGKTFLIKEYFNQQFSFYATGVARGNTAMQLRAFHASLKAYGSPEKDMPEDWFEALERLRALLMSKSTYRDPMSGKMVVFFDELPWMDTARSDFKSALDYFWNSWGSSQKDFVLIVCGSATSWITKHLLKDRGGFHNRITRRIQLLPFTLQECQQLLESNGNVMTQAQMIECYMIFGGIPYYLNLLDTRLSLAQNVEELCFKPYGELRDEFDELFRSLFKKPEKYLDVIRSLGETKKGKTRKELIENPSIDSGAGLTKVLEELEQCGFIRRYTNYTTPANGAFFQLVDPFTLFSLRYLLGSNAKNWMEYINSSGYHAWRGNAFEIVCLNHVPQMKAALGISGVATEEFSWQSKETTPGAQIDLLLDRHDGIINLCEMKDTNEPFETDKTEYENIMHRLSAFQEETKPKKAIHITLVSANGLKRNKYSGVFQSIITGDDLFAV